MKREVASRKPYARWYERERPAPLRPARAQSAAGAVRRSRCAAGSSLFGYAQEDMKVMLAPLARNAEEAVGSMGNDTPLAVLSGAQAAPLLVLQAAVRAGDEPADRLDPRGGGDERAGERRLGAQPPRRDARARAPARDREPDPPRRRARAAAPGASRTSSARTRSTRRGRSPTARTGSSAALERICADADEALAAGANILVLSDRAAGPERVPIPSLLATAAVHHHLVREGTRLQAGIVVESGEPRSVHAIAVLVGYGAAAVNPYLMLETLGELVELGWLPDGMTAEQAQRAGGQGDRQGTAQGDLEDGHLDDPVVLRRADLRGRRALVRARRPLLHLHRLAHRRHRPARARRGCARASRPRVPGLRRRRCCP